MPERGDLGRDRHGGGDEIQAPARAREHLNNALAALEEALDSGRELKDPLAVRVLECVAVARRRVLMADKVTTAVVASLKAGIPEFTASEVRTRL